MAYYVLVYDVRQERVGRVLKIVRRYLNWVQNSVAEGELTRSEVTDLQKELARVISDNEDSVIIYELKFEVPKRVVMGRSKGGPEPII